MQARTDITVGKMSNSSEMVCKSWNDEKTLKMEEDNLRSTGFPLSHLYSRNFVMGEKKKKNQKFSMNDQKHLARVRHGKAPH